MLMRTSGNRRAWRCAFSLVEVTLALGIVAFGILAVFGLLVSGMKVSRESVSENTAVNILSAIVADIGNSDGSATASHLFSVPLGAANEGTKEFDENGMPVPGAGSGVFRASWNVYAKDEGKGLPARVFLRVAWPAVNSASSGWVEGLVPLNGHVATN